jgi:hypothetical protein
MLKSQITIPKSLILILSFLIFNSVICLAQDTIIDTVYSIAELDGGITYSPGLEFYDLSTDVGPFLVGDTYSMIFWDYFYNRGFVSFELPEIPEGYFLDSAFIYLFQATCVGNDIYGNYPIFNLPNDDFEPPCLLDHIDYGFYLDVYDFHESLIQCVGVISNTPEADWRSLNITECIFDDIENLRQYTQYRLRLSMDMDLDPFLDGLFFHTADPPTDLKPYIKYCFIQNSYSTDSIIDQTLNISLNAYPNPFNPIINFEIKSSNDQTKPMRIEVFNVKGQKMDVLTFPDEIGTQHGSIVWNAEDFVSGVYYCKLVNIEDNKVLSVKKITLLK